MRIELRDISKRFTNFWILKRINFVFDHSCIYGITGLNGSGKSSLMQIISGQLSPTLGTINYLDNGERILDINSIFSKITFSAPYISPMENLTLDESVELHTRFRKLKRGIKNKEFNNLLNFSFKADQYVKYYSSGMKQRLSLALSILTETDLILLDEPGSFLDEQGKSWFHALLEEYKEESTVIISSNESSDLISCGEFLHLS